MLAPDSRTLLIDQLAPPPGCNFDAAIATTYTLDLTATLLPALAFTGFHLAGGQSDPIATLESIRSTADRIDVFCQAGAIAVPDRAPDLLAFLEPMIHPVRAPGAGLFHPKIWFIRYDAAGIPAYRLLVLTRNLTMDSSWDVAVRLDSQRLAQHAQPQSSALADFLRSLPGRTAQEMDDNRTERIRALAEEAARIVWEHPRGVDDVQLHYLHPGREQTLDLSGSRHLVVSPFVDAPGLRHVRDRGRMDILSRVEELEKLDPETVSRLDARVLDDLAVVQAVDGSQLAGSLHAKMYIVEQRRNWSRSHVFIGSANATGAAFGSNTEIMVELRGHKSQLGIDCFLGSDGAFLSLTEPYRPTGTLESDPDDAAQRELDNAVRRIAGLTYTVEVLPVGPDRTDHDLRLTSAAPFRLGPGWFATVELLTVTDFSAPVVAGNALDALVPGVTTGDISPFLTVRVESPTGRRAATVVVAELRNSPDERLDVVLARQIDTPDKFLRFLYFLLSLGNPSALAGMIDSRSGATAGGNPVGEGGSGVLEMVLGALASNPSALADLDALVARLASTPAGLRSLPDGFLGFWGVVRDAAGLDRDEAE